ncbi:MAG: pyrroline-5-carboxylate reductase [Firmicutes bacterium]|nr:pyrroline-5-carboxylate reductase [Bacillota bacterium]
MNKISFIGTGNMGGAILRAVCRKADPSLIWISNRTRSKSEALEAELGCRVADDNAACAKDADIVFIGVKPYMAAAVLAEIADGLRDDTLVVSMAAGISGEKISRSLGRPNAIVRILPNTPCAIGKGLVLLSPYGSVPEAVTDMLEDLLSECGEVGFLDESHAEAGMTIGGCTPAFTYMFIEALADGAVQTGLTRADSLRWAAQAVAGSAEMILRTGRHPEELKDSVCSPGGSTIEGVRVLEESGFRGAAMDAVIAAFEKSSRLG